MKQMSKWIALTMMVFMMMGGYVFAANGTCQSMRNTAQAEGQSESGTCQASQNCLQSGPQSANGALDRPCLIILSGEPVTISGTVYEAPYAGQGMTVDTGEELVTVYGIGPQWYWDYLGVEKPGVGETVEIDAVIVTFSDDTEKVIALTVTVGDDVVDLRDENGRPVWRFKGRLL